LEIPRPLFSLLWSSEILQTKILKRAVFHNSNSVIAELVVVIYIFALILKDWYYLPIDEGFQVYSVWYYVSVPKIVNNIKTYHKHKKVSLDARESNTITRTKGDWRTFRICVWQSIDLTPMTSIV